MRTLFHGDSYELQEFDLAKFSRTVVDGFRSKIDREGVGFIYYQRLSEKGVTTLELIDYFIPDLALITQFG